MNDEKRPVGEWIYDTTIAGMRYYHCSICATGYNTIADECEVNWWRFCPRCGSKMLLRIIRRKKKMTDIENIDGYVSKDSLYRLLSNYRMTHVLTEKERSIVHDIIVAITDMPNEKEEEE